MQAEMTAGAALRQAQATMDGVYVDANNDATYLADVDLDADSDGPNVVVGHDAHGSLVLTLMDDDGFLGAHYGTVHSVDRAQALGY